MLNGDTATTARIAIRSALPADPETRIELPGAKKPT